ncbi:hypothetical protein [Streptomyces sp. NPDC088752]|uniref:hypothetical protein n=1 Tax=Streptomyces sp. NPDC088752 TaxID=3154963 RepID=UPI003419E6E6
MTDPTATQLRVPPYIQDAMNSSVDAGWTVVRNPKSVIITPHPAPKSKRLKAAFSLSNPPTADQVRKDLTNLGLYRALEHLQEQKPPAAQTEQAPATPAVVPPQTAPPESKPDVLACPECSKPFRLLQGLGAHRRMAHGVIGMSPKTIQRRESAARKNGKKKAASLPAAAAKKTVPTPRKTAEPAPATAPVIAEPAPAAPATGDVHSSLNHLIVFVREAEDKLAEKDDTIRELQNFKDKVSAEIANGNQSPIQTLANIMALGGEGFGTPAA